MNKQEIYAFLAAKGLWHEITEHRAVYTMAELSDIAVPYPEADAKNLFVRDEDVYKRQCVYCTCGGSGLACEGGAASP